LSSRQSYWRLSFGVASELYRKLASAVGNPVAYRRLSTTPECNFKATTGSASYHVATKHEHREIDRAMLDEVLPTLAPALGIT